MAKKGENFIFKKILHFQFENACFSRIIHSIIIMRRWTVKVFNSILFLSIVMIVEATQ